MQCSEWQQMLDEYIDGRLTAEQSAAFEAHAATCPACAELLAAYRQTVSMLHTMPEEPLPAGFAADLHDRLLALAAEQNQTQANDNIQTESIATTVTAAPMRRSKIQKLMRNTKLPRIAAALLICAWGLGTYVYLGGELLPRMGSSDAAAPEAYSTQAAYDTADIDQKLQTAAADNTAAEPAEKMQDTNGAAPDNLNNTVQNKADSGAYGTTMRTAENDAAAADGANVPKRKFGDVSQQKLATALLALALLLFIIWIIYKYRLRKRE